MAAAAAAAANKRVESTDWGQVRIELSELLLAT
jgi:hypothetical protein